MRHLLLGFLLLLRLGCLAAAPAPPTGAFSPPGLVSYTYRHSFEKDVAATLDTIKALGFTDLEFSNLFGHTAADLRRLLDARGLTCSSFGVSYPDLQTKLAEVGQNANALGAKYVRVAWVPHQGPFTLDLATQTAADFNRFGRVLRDTYGLTFCYHCHGYEFEPYQKGTLFDYLAQHTEPKYVGFELDILWATMGGQNPAALLGRYGKRVKVLHLKDLRKGVAGNLSGGTPVENDVALGTGQIDLLAVLKAARRAGVAHYYLEDESPNVARQVPQSLAYLKSLRP